jgi:hypothetical protein
MSFFNRNKKLFSLLTLFAFLAGTILYSYEYINIEFQNITRERMKLAGAICFGILSVYKLVEIISEFRLKQKS